MLIRFDVIIEYSWDKNSEEDIEVGSEKTVSINGQNKDKKVITSIIPATIAERNPPRINGTQSIKLFFQVL